MKPTCIICNSESRFFMNKDVYDLFKCSSCGLVFVYPQPTADFLKKEVYSIESGFQSNRAEDLTKINKYSRYETVFDYVLSYKRNPLVLDVGSSGGQKKEELLLREWN